MRDLLEFAKAGAPGRKHLRAVDDQPSIFFVAGPVAHPDAVTRLDGSILILNHEKDTAQAFTRRENWCGND